ncbi:MAG: sulfatase-like hydrolase/transferase [Spirochaetes bacterium]|nr:sulfatase-like hydrolase/transferase [Spirochaetota bacterium]
MATLLLWFGVFLLYHFFVFVFASGGAPGIRDILSALIGDAACALALDTALAAVRQTHMRRVATGGMLLGTGAFLLFTFGFTRLYERPFTWSFIRTDSLSIWRENFISALYEFGLPHFLLLVTLVAVFYLIARRNSPHSGPRHAATMLGVACSGIIGAWLIQQKPPGMFSNPLVASFGGKPRAAAVAVTVSADDVIPDLDSPEGRLMLPPDVPRGKKKNVILYFIESTPRSVIDKKVQGKELTPHLNRLKQRSLFFDRHYANFPLSINAFYNASCSAYALPDGAWISLALPDFPVPCLSQILKKKGYRTVGLHAGYLGYAKQKRFMQKRDFDLLMDAETVKKPPYEKGMGPWGAADERALMKPLTEFIAADPQKPFFATLFAFAPHHPYNTPEDYPELLNDDGGFKKQQRTYFNSLHFADEAFGTILADLTQKGLMKDTILIAFGDHGEAFYEHRGNYNHPFFIYEENIRVPLFIWFEGIKPGEVTRVTSHVDILPTVLDLLDLKAQLSPMHVGHSMLKGGAASVAHIQAFWQEEFSGIVDQRYKFIRKETGARELFDLTADAGEQVNLADKEPAVSELYNRLTEKAFAQKRAYYKKYGNYELVRFKPSSQDK